MWYLITNINIDFFTAFRLYHLFKCVFLQRTLRVLIYETCITEVIFALFTELCTCDIESVVYESNMVSDGAFLADLEVTLDTCIDLYMRVTVVIMCGMASITVKIITFYTISLYGVLGTLGTSDLK